MNDLYDDTVREDAVAVVGRTCRALTDVPGIVRAGCSVVRGAARMLESSVATSDLSDRAPAARSVSGEL